MSTQTVCLIAAFACWILGIVFYLVAGYLEISGR